MKVNFLTNGIPVYRLGFYESLSRSNSVHFKLYASKGLKTYATRLDQSKRIDQLRYTYVRSISSVIFGKEVVLQFPPRDLFNCDYLIVHDESKYMMNYVLGVLRMFFKFKTVYFTHGKMIHGKNFLIRALYKIFAHRADYFLTYTPSSTNFLIDKGIDSGRIRHFFNTIDTLGLRIENGDVGDILSLKNRYRIAFVGTLHSERRFEKVLEVFKKLHENDNRYILDVFGAGPLLQLYQSQNLTNVIFHGFVSGKDLQVVLREVMFVLNPGLIGLNLVDCVFAHAIMITDCEYPKHSPEVYYINENDVGYSIQWSIDNVIKIIKEFSSVDGVRILRNQQELKVDLTTQKMAERVIHGLLTWSER